MRVEIEDRFAEFGAAFDSAVRVAIVQTAAEARGRLAAVFPGSIGASARIGAVEAIENGWRGSAYLDDFRANILDKGSLGKRRSPLKQPGRQERQWTVRRGGSTFTAHRSEEALASGGIAPRGYTRAITAAMKGRLAENVQREIGKLG